MHAPPPAGLAGRCGAIRMTSGTLDLFSDTMYFPVHESERGRRAEHRLLVQRLTAWLRHLFSTVGGRCTPIL
eukprot:4088552-Pyramimonas_sp.AAC.1